MRKIGLIGGSFDPIHEGHLNIAKIAKKKIALKEVWFLPARISPFKDVVNTTFKDRYNMVKLAISPYRYMKVKDYEDKLPEPSYTINTIRYILRKYQNVKLYFIIGDDQLPSLHKWKDYELLSKLVEFVVISRFDIDSQYPFMKIDVENHPASSTSIRNGDFKYVPYLVNKYINENVLYYDNIVNSKLSKYRYNHTIQVMNLAIEFADRYKIPIKKAQLAALLHDFVKEWSIEDLEKYMKIYYPEYLSRSYKIWHSYVGAIIARDDFGIIDSDIFKAIFHHTDGESDNLLADIIFCADKAEPTRKYPTKHLKEICLENIKLGKKRIIEEMKEV